MDFLTFNEESRELNCDVLSDPQSVPGVDGPVGEHYPAGADVVAAVILVGLGNGLCHLFSTYVVEVCTLLHLITGFKEENSLYLMKLPFYEVLYDRPIVSIA